MSLRTKLHCLLKSETCTNGASAETAVFRAATGRAAGALKCRAGFTLTEALATVIIVGLVTSILASGIALASRQYVQSMSVSEAQMLYSSLQKILDTELRFTSSFEVDASGNVTSFESKHYIAKGTGEGGLQATSVLCTVPTGSSGTTANAPNTPGLLGMASGFGDDVVTNVFLGKGSYNYGLEASVPAFRFNENTGFFELTLAISKGSGEDRQVFAEGSFTVRALNAYHKPTTNPPSGGGEGGNDPSTPPSTDPTPKPIVVDTEWKSDDSPNINEADALQISNRISTGDSVTLTAPRDMTIVLVAHNGKNENSAVAGYITVALKKGQQATIVINVEVTNGLLIMDADGLTLDDLNLSVIPK